jgi:hypothetical protein
MLVTPLSGAAPLVAANHFSVAGLFFQLVIAGGHDRQPLQRHQARERQRAVFDVIDEQQLDRLVTEHLAFALEAVVRGAGEGVALQRHQLQRRAAIEPAIAVCSSLLALLTALFSTPSILVPVYQARRR